MKKVLLFCLLAIVCNTQTFALNYHMESNQKLLLRDMRKFFELNIENDSIFMWTNLSYDDTLRLYFDTKSNFDCSLNFYKAERRKFLCFEQKYYAKRSEIGSLYSFLDDVESITFSEIREMAPLSSFFNSPDVLTKINRTLYQFIVNGNETMYKRRNSVDIYSDSGLISFNAERDSLVLYTLADFGGLYEITICGEKDGAPKTSTINIPFRGMNANYSFVYYIPWRCFYGIMDEITAIEVEDKLGNKIFKGEELQKLGRIYNAIQAACVTENYIMFPH